MANLREGKGKALACRLEKEMEVMMILMVVLLVVGGHGAHMGSHDPNHAPSKVSQSHEHGTAKAAPEKP